jgi:multidrug efflux pump subunit AcrA (membrane-fusion protein)
MKHVNWSRALSLATIALASCSSNAQKPKGPPPLSITTTQVRRETLATFVTLDGQVDPFLQANVATEQGGTILKIYANEGDRVSEGQTLAKIDDAPLRATLGEQQGARGAADAKLSEAQTQLPITNTLYASALTQAQESVTQARERLIADRANVANTKATFSGDEQLVRQGYVAQTTFEQARASYVAARQTLVSDVAAVAQAEAGLAEARRNLLNTNLQQHVVEENRGSVEQAEGTVQLTQTQLGETVLTAPFSGVVTSRLLDPGAYASSNQAIYQLSQIDPTYVDFNLKDVDLAYVHEGTIVSFTTSAHPGRRYAGTVSTINAVPTTGTLLYRARIVMRNPDYSLRGGMLVAVKVTKEERRNVLVAPRDAVTQNNGNGEIFAVVPNDAGGSAGSSPAPAPQPSGSSAPVMRAHRIVVKTGIQTDTYVEIVSPAVHDGLTIVATRPDQLQDKMSIVSSH